MKSHRGFSYNRALESKMPRKISKRKGEKDMARNYSIAEAVEILTHGEDLESIADIGKRYPLLAQKIAVVGTKAGESFVDLMSYMPEHVSANKVNSAIKRQLENAEDSDDEEEEEAPKAKKAAKEQVKKTGKAGRPKKVEEDIEDDDDDADSDYDSMNNKQMYDLLGKMGKREDCKEKFGDLSHDSMLKYFKKYGAATDVEDEEEDEDDADEVDYSSMKSMELYKLCKQRKIKAEAKKPAKYYIDLLKKADAAEAEDADDEDWEDDEEEVEEAPKKKAGRPKKEAAPKKATKKAAKKAEPEEEEDEDDDDDEWDI